MRIMSFILNIVVNYEIKKYAPLLALQSEYPRPYFFRLECFAEAVIISILMGVSEWLRKIWNVTQYEFDGENEKSFPTRVC